MKERKELEHEKMTIFIWREKGEEIRMMCKVRKIEQKKDEQGKTNDNSKKKGNILQRFQKSAI